MASDAQTKLVPCWFGSPRDATAAYQFIHDLEDRLAVRVQLTIDGNRAYLAAVKGRLRRGAGLRCTGQIYGEGAEVRYFPAKCMGTRKAVLNIWAPRRR